MNYGGIYLDNDVYVVKKLDEYLKYEMTVSWDEPREIHGLGNHSKINVETYFC